MTLSVFQIVLVVAIVAVIACTLGIAFYNWLHKQNDEGKNASDIIIEVFEQIVDNKAIRKMMSTLYNKTVSREFSTAQDYMDYIFYEGAVQVYKYLSNYYPYISVMVNTEICKEAVKKLFEQMGIDEQKLLEHYNEDIELMIASQEEDSQADNEKE